MKWYCVTVTATNQFVIWRPNTDWMVLRNVRNAPITHNPSTARTVTDFEKHTY